MATSKPTLININKLNKILSQQRKVFEGYLRSNIVSINVNVKIPIDLINLCYKFFEINITNTLKFNEENNIDGDTLHKEAGKLYDSYEYHIAYLILSILINSNDQIPKYHNLMGMVLQDWSHKGKNDNNDALSASQKEFEIAIQLKQHSHIYRWNYGMII